MNRLMLPVMGTLLLCAQSYGALAADSTSTVTTTNAYEQLREQVAAQRDQLSGAVVTGKSTPATVLDAPIETDDAPSQEQQP